MTWNSVICGLLRPISRHPLGQAECDGNGQQDDGEHTRLACAFRRSAETGLGEPQALTSPGGRGRGGTQPTIFRCVGTGQFRNTVHAVFVINRSPT